MCVCVCVCVCVFTSEITDLCQIVKNITVILVLCLSPAFTLCILWMAVGIYGRHFV